MKTSVILIIIGILMIIAGLDPVDGKLIIAGCITGIAGWSSFLFGKDKKRMSRKDDGGKSLRNSKTWKDDDVR